MKAKRKLKSGPIVNSLPSHRDQGVLDAGGNRTDSVAYSFVVDGGAAGTYLFGRKLPAGAIVTAVKLDEITATDLSSMTLNCGAQALVSAADLTAVSGVANLTLVAAAGIKIAVESELQMVAGDAITAGSFRMYVSYLLSND